MIDDEVSNRLEKNVRPSEVSLIYLYYRMEKESMSTSHEHHENHECLRLSFIFKTSRRKRDFSSTHQKFFCEQERVWLSPELSGPRKNVQIDSIKNIYNV